MDSQLQKKQSDIEAAKKLLEKEKQERAKQFQEELAALCEKYQCEITFQPIIIPK